jgi:hypothetical protein
MACWPTPTAQDFKKRGPNSSQFGLAESELPMGNAEYDGSSAATLGGSDGENAGADRSARGAITPQQSAGTDCLAHTACAENIVRESGNWIARSASGTGFNPAAGDGGALMWPTVTTQDAKNNAGPSQFERNTKPLNVEAVLHSSRSAWARRRLGRHPTKS